MYVCPSNVNFINTMIIMKKIIYLVLLSLITGLVAQAHEKTGEWNGCDPATISPSRIAKQPLSFLKKLPKEIHGSGVQRSSTLFQVWTKHYWKKGSTLSITTSLIYMEVQEQFLWAPNSMRI